MNYRDYGSTGLRVSVLGFGGSHIGQGTLDEKKIDHLLNGALDLGITLFDTACTYSLSEERIGRYLSHRRREMILSTKIGFGIDGYEDWTKPIIHAGITEALKRYKTDYLDIAHLYSCPLEILKKADVLEALQKEVQDGRVRVAAYTGENEALMYAIESGAFGGIQCSINIADQHSIDAILPIAVAKGMGITAKRALASIAWQYDERPAGSCVEVYWERLQKMKLKPSSMAWLEMALRFPLTVPGIHSSVVGTGNLSHVRHNVELSRKGNLSKTLITRIRNAYLAHDSNWMGQL